MTLKKRHETRLFSPENGGIWAPARLQDGMAVARQRSAGSTHLCAAGTQNEELMVGSTELHPARMCGINDTGLTVVLMRKNRKM